VKQFFVFVSLQILQPLCHEIETDLRLLVHSHLQLDERNPLRGEINNCAPLLQTQPLRFFDQYIYVKGNAVINNIVVCFLMPKMIFLSCYVCLPKYLPSFLLIFIPYRPIFIFYDLIT
jgi:hypothetical protein